MATKKEMLVVLTTLQECFPNHQLSDEGIELYCRALADLDSKALGAGAWACVKACKFFPTIAEIREAAGAGPGDEAIPQYARDSYRIGSGEPARQPDGVKHPLPPGVREMLDKLKAKCAMPYTPPPPKTATFHRETWTPQKIHLTPEEVAAQSRRAAEMQAQFARMAQDEKAQKQEP